MRLMPCFKIDPIRYTSTAVKSFISDLEAAKQRHISSNVQKKGNKKPHSGDTAICIFLIKIN
jgi:hypothetical protein